MSESIRQGELVGKGLMAYETTEELGSAEYVLVDVKRSLAAGLVYKSPGLIARKQTISWKNVAKIGGDRILVHTQPTADDAELAAAQDMTGLEVWTDGGDCIGALVDLRIDRETGEVQQYLFALSHEQTEAENTESATINVYAITPQMIISAGRKRLMIAEEDAQRAQANSEEIAQSPTQSAFDKRAADRPTSYRPGPLPSNLPTDFESLLEKGKSLAEKATQQARARARQFTDERLAHQDLVEADSLPDILPDITEQLQAKTEQAKQQIQQQLGKAAERAEKAKEQVDGQLGKSALGRSLGNSFNQAINKIRRPEADTKPIDVDAFEVWEDD